MIARVTFMLILALKRGCFELWWSWIHWLSYSQVSSSNMSLSWPVHPTIILHLQTKINASACLHHLFLIFKLWWELMECQIS